MTIEQNKEFQEKLTALLKEYNVDIFPQMTIAIRDLPKQEEVVTPEVKEEK